MCIRDRYADGYKLDSDELDEALLSEAKSIAKQADVAIIFAGLPERYESEGYDLSLIHI